MPKTIEEKQAKLFLRLECDGEVAEHVIEGADKIAWVLGEGGIFHEDFQKILRLSTTCQE